VFLGYLRGTWRNLKFLLISTINFYYVINEMIILLSDSHKFGTCPSLKYLSIRISLFLTIEFRKINDSG
jgi:hypothetical protein